MNEIIAYRNMKNEVNNLQKKADSRLLAAHGDML